MSGKSLAKIPAPPNAEIIEKVMMEGDLKGLSPEQRLNYYRSVCETLGLNPLTKPFDYITLDGKLVLYARKDATEQLRKRYGISCKVTHREQQEAIYIVTAQASLPDGRVDESIGAVAILEPDRIKKRNDNNSWTWMANPKAGHVIPAMDLANAVMKAETKAKRRVTLSICGLGMLDETELETTVNHDREFDQRSESEIAERNVREATAHATGERNDTFPVSGDTTVTDNRSNQYGPLEITQDNYKLLEAHVGKAQGRILGRKVGELERPVIEWLHNKWRESLGPSATEQDMRLKLAVEFAYKNKPVEPQSDGSGSEDKSKQPESVPADVGEKKSAINDLLKRFEDLVLTEEVAMQYMVKFGLANEGWTKLDQIPVNILLYLCTPKGWETWKAHYESLVKPKPTQKPPRKRARK